MGLVLVAMDDCCVSEHLVCRLISSQCQSQLSGNLRNVLKDSQIIFGSKKSTRAMDFNIPFLLR